MKLPKFSGKLKRPKPLIVRRVVGESMSPALRPGDVIWATGIFRSLRLGEIVVVRHDGLEKIKRIADVHNNRVFLVGDNPAQSTDSRSFGWLDAQVVIAKVVWTRA